MREVALAVAVAAGLMLANDQGHAQAPDPFQSVVPGRPPVPKPRPAPAPALQAASVVRDCPGCPELVRIPAGSFEMGVPEAESQREGTGDFVARPVHTVRIGQAFYLGKYHVTRGQYAAFARATGRDVEKPSFDQTDDHPVVKVNWNDAQAYVAWLSQRTGKRYRLPTEAEWEYAARAGTTTARYWGDSAAQQCQYANGSDQTAQPGGTMPEVAPCSDGFTYTSPSGSFRPNGFGLYDMLGNADQWVQDCNSRDYNAVPADGSAYETTSCSSRVQRGGSFGSFPWWLRAGSRNSVVPGARLFNYSFRVARTLTP